MIKIFNPIPQEYQHLVPDFDIESRTSLRRIFIIGLPITSVLYALFSLADYWFYPTFAQILLIPRWLAILIWCLIAALLYWRRELQAVYAVTITVVMATALLTEALLIISKDPTGPYLVVFPILMLAFGTYPWPAKWIVSTNLLYLLVFTVAPPLFGVIGDVPRFIFYCAMMTTAAIGSVAVHTILTRLRWESFLNRRQVEETSAENARLYEEVKRFNKLVLDEQEKSESLLLNILPKEIVAILKNENRVIADQFDNASILFADVVNFTPMSASMTPTELVELLNEVYSHFDGLVEKYDLEKIKTIGDCYMVAAGVPRRRPDHALVLTQLALDIHDYVGKHEFHGRQLKFRIGINSGSVVAGVIGRKKFAYDLWGDTVNTASRMESHGSGGFIQITEDTYNLIKNDFNCESHGKVNVKGKGEISVWYVTDKLS